MTTAILGVSVETGAPALNARAVAVPIPAAGVNDAAALARQQLVNAVPSPALIAAYSANVPQQPKPIVRAPIALPSSSLAAQFIAQDVAATLEELAIFTPRPTATAVSDAPVVDDYLSALRIARGDVPPTKTSAANANAAGPSQQATTTRDQAEIATARIVASATNDTVARNVVAQAATGLPALFNQFIRKPTILTARGLGAYQLAEARNAATRKVAAAT